MLVAAVRRLDLEQDSSRRHSRGRARSSSVTLELPETHPVRSGLMLSTKRTMSLTRPE